MNSGMYKNAFTCGIPNSRNVGNVFAAALGYVAGDAEKGLLSLADVVPEDTMRNMGLIASPCMVGTEKTIVEIFEGKLK